MHTPTPTPTSPRSIPLFILNADGSFHCAPALLKRQPIPEILADLIEAVTGSEAIMATSATIRRATPSQTPRPSRATTKRPAGGPRDRTAKWMRDIEEYLRKQNGKPSARGIIARTLNLNPQNVSTAMRNLCKMGIVQKIGNRGDAVYVLSDIPAVEIETEVKTKTKTKAKTKKRAKKTTKTVDSEKGLSESVHKILIASGEPLTVQEIRRRTPHLSGPQITGCLVSLRQRGVVVKDETPGTLATYKAQATAA